MGSEVTIVIRLTDAQVSAMECRDWSEEPAVLRCWDGAHRITFCETDRDALWDNLRDATNAEDAYAEMKKDVYARRAAISLSAVAGKVLTYGQA